MTMNSKFINGIIPIFFVKGKIMNIEFRKYTQKDYEYIYELKKIVTKII